MLAIDLRIPLLAALCLLPACPGSAQNPVAPAGPRKLSLTAALVLTPEFCATVKKQRSEKFFVGKASCSQLEPVLKGIFTSLTRVDDASKAGDAQVVLEPQFADVGATQKSFAFSNRELVISVDWTVRDQTGRALWIGNARGSASRHIGNAFTYGSNLKHILQDSVQDLAEESATDMSSSTELLKLSDAAVK